MLILRNDDVSEMLTLDAAMCALETMFRDQARGVVSLPVRRTLFAENGGWLRLMPAIHNARNVMGFKVMSHLADVGARAFISLIDSTCGDVVALLDGNRITILRTAAMTAIATKLFAPESVHVMALLGSGTLAEAVLHAAAAVRTLPLVNVYSPNAEHCIEFAERMSRELGLDVRAVDSPQAALDSADLVCGAFRADSMPLIQASGLRADAHINSLSSVEPSMREVTASLWRTCSCVVVDHRAAVAQSGDGVAVLRDHPFDLERAPELWEIARDGRSRTQHDGITMFKSAGAATQDIALAMLAYGLAGERGVGQEIAGFPTLRAPR